MQVATVSTRRPSLRSDIDGWGFEDASLLVRRADPRDPHKLFIGYTPSPKDIPHYTCILEMLADGWELLGPPEHETWTNEDGEEKKHHEQWNWWLSRKASSPRSST